MTPERPDYKLHPLWNEAIALAHEAYALAEELRKADPEAARGLRRVAVSVPALVAGALSAESPRREADAVGARAALAALAEVALLAARAPAAGGAARILLRRTRALEQSAAMALGAPGRFVC